MRFGWWMVSVTVHVQYHLIYPGGNRNNRTGIRVFVYPTFVM
jgi:hypothetical protein